MINKIINVYNNKKFDQLANLITDNSNIFEKYKVKK